MMLEHYLNKIGYVFYAIEIQGRYKIIWKDKNVHTD